MTPEQRIAAVLHSRGLEATTEQVAAWIEKMNGLFREKYGYPLPGEALADAIEDGQSTWTLCLHLEFGDALKENR